jgi:hypothetical protein
MSPELLPLAEEGVSVNQVVDLEVSALRGLSDLIHTVIMPLAQSRKVRQRELHEVTFDLGPLVEALKHTYR